MLGRALAQAERLGAQARVNGVSLPLAHVLSSEGSGGQDCLAGQLPGDDPVRPSYLLWTTVHGITSIERDDPASKDGYVTAHTPTRRT